VLGVVDSGLPGPKGNREFLLHLVQSDRPTLPDDLDARIDEAVAAGEISSERYDSYAKLRGELQLTEKKWATMKTGSYDAKKRGR